MLNIHVRNREKLISCKWCNEILIDPVFLLCGETACAKHEQHFKDSIEDRNESEKNSEHESDDEYSNQICKLCDEYL